jgi:hypothetical protein
MKFNEEIRAIQNNWTTNKISKRTAIIEFEQAMRELGLIPQDQWLNYEMDDKEFLDLLQKAEAVNPVEIKKLQAKIREEDDAIMEEYAGWKLCHHCHKPMATLFTYVNVQIAGDSSTKERIQLDVPRCGPCVKEYLDQYVFKTKSRPLPTQPLTVEIPMSPSELEFFQFYEKQMREFNNDK